MRFVRFIQSKHEIPLIWQKPEAGPVKVIHVCRTRNLRQAPELTRMKETDTFSATHHCAGYSEILNAPLRFQNYRLCWLTVAKLNHCSIPLYRKSPVKVNSCPRAASDSMAQNLCVVDK